MTYLIGLICFLFVAVFSSQTLVDICDTMIVVTAGVLIFKNKDILFLKNFSRIWLFWVSWLVVIFLGLFMNSSEFPWLNFLEFRWFLSFFALIYVLMQIKSMNNLIKSIGVVTLALNIIAIALYFIRDEDRAGGIYHGIMAFSQNMGMVLCFFVTYLSCVYKFGLHSQLSRRYKFIFLLAAITSVYLVLLTLTRGVWISCAMGVSVSALFIPKKVFTYTLICIVLIFAGLSYTNTSFNERVYAKDQSTQVSNNQRKNIWTANFEIFKDFPIFGAGYSENNKRLTEYYDKLNIPQTELKSHAHNQYLHFAAGTGFAGLFMYLIFSGFIFIIALKGYRNTDDISLKTINLSLLSALISFLIAGLTESNFSISKNRLLFLFFCAFIMALKLNKNPKYLNTN
jgi:O-antigen ligase